MLCFIRYLCLIFYLLCFHPIYILCSSQGKVVGKWANTLGRDLWDLGSRITKFSEIEQRYHLLNAQVEVKDAMELLDEIVEDISRMMDRKMDAIQCIINVAENKSEEFQYNSNTTFYYYNSKYSPVTGQTAPKYDLKVLNDSLYRYRPLDLNEDTHFYNLPVNTNHSSVHVPTNIYDLHETASIAIQWSEALDEVFVQNYNSDPSLSWQYFGSYSGIMRHYPAMTWQKVNGPDLFDCRIRTWFIEAATCTKDIVILLDNSGSMDAMGKHIGVLTASSILDTLSNNDYVNILNYTEHVNFTISCFKNLLVQATEENIYIFKRFLNNLKPVNKTNIEQGLVAAFELLAQYREIRGCDGLTAYCNQAIMVITDGLPSNMSEIVMKYNFLLNGTYKPVRIFSYLVGQEVSGVEEMKWLACASRGYFTHIQAIEQVTSAVLEYINVIARPLVLQEEEHPVSWTHVYMDETYNDNIDQIINEPYRMLTSAAAPAFDKSAYKKGKTTNPTLLGVAATDVPIADIAKLTLPYKIGVCGYAFIVTNNGYVLMHPDLRPMIKGIKTNNYNSIDLTEVEQIYTDPPLTARALSKKVLELRSLLVNGSTGTLENITIKYHYDHMRRISIEEYDYYFSPLENTPFTLALAIPKQHGRYFLKVGDEIGRNRHTGNNLTDFFSGNNWKIHPKWVYCKYHYVEGHEYNNSESELLDFLSKMYDQNFQWERQYEASVKKENQTGGVEKEDLGKVECGRKSLTDDDYYCDKQLVQRLVFDARNTKDSFNEPWDFQESEKRLFDKYDVSVRFVATMSGLTRWEYKNESAVNNKKKFGEYHSRAIDETWYKSAVLQHQYDPEAFVYAISDQIEDDLVITGSYAIFPKDAGIEAPGSVVGFQFSQNKFEQKFREITLKPSADCPHCKTCNSMSCYIVDSSGYILVAMEENLQGRFFGEIEGDIMESMIKEKIFNQVDLYDYQAICELEREITISAGIMSKPFEFLQSGFYWMVETSATKIMELQNIFSVWKPIVSSILNQTEPKLSETIDDENVEKHSTIIACDNIIHLYVLQQKYLKSNNFSGEFKAILDNEKVLRREYYIKRIPYSNLILIAIDKAYKKSSEVIYSTQAELVTHDVPFPCHKINLNNLPRGTLRGCFFHNKNEELITECVASHCKSSLNLILFVILSIIYKMM